MKYYVQIETPKPPEGATHYNHDYGLPFEKHDGDDVYLWIGDKWKLLGLPQIRRGSPRPIIFK